MIVSYDVILQNISSLRFSDEEFDTYAILWQHIEVVLPANQGNVNRNTIACQCVFSPIRIEGANSFSRLFF